MPVSDHKNFAISTLASPPSGTGGTSLTVGSGHGALFPTAPFNVTVWPAGVQPTSSNAEIMRVTNKATDVFTVTRAQEGSSARTFAANDQIAASITARTLTDVEYGAHGIFNVKDPVYGAVGDGSTDDTAAIQAAINAANTAGGGKVYLPRSTYKLSAALTLQSNIELYGDGPATILSGTLTSTTDPVLYAVSETGMYVHDLTIAGTHSWGVLWSGGSNNRVERCAISGGTRKDTSASKGGGIFVENATNITIRDNVLSGNAVADTSGYYDILLNFGTYSVTDSEVSGNECTSAATINIVGFDCLRTRILYNRCANADTPSSTPTTGGYGIALYRTATTLPSAVGENIVSYNAVRAVDGTGIYIQSMRDCIISYNSVIDCASVQTDGSLSVAGIAIHYSPGSVVVGNSVVDSGLDGIEITSTTASAWVTATAYVAGDVRTNGGSEYLCTSAHTSGGGTEPGVGGSWATVWALVVYSFSSSFSTVSGNTVRDCLQGGITIRGTLSDCTITGNTVENVARDGIGCWSDLAATRITISGNTVRPNNAGGYRGIFLAASTSACRVFGNTISATSGDGIVDSGTGNFVDYRQVTDGYRSTSSSITARKDDFVIAVDASGAARTITLPAAAKYEGQVYVIKKTDSSVNTVTVDGDSSETIDGALTYVLAAQYQSVTVLCTGTGWLVL